MRQSAELEFASIFTVNDNVVPASRRLIL